MQKEQNVSNCSECLKNNQLIQKYLALIDLLKKKNDKSNLSTTIKHSIDAPTTSQTVHMHHKRNKMKLAMLCAHLQQRCKSQVIQMISQQAVQERCHRGFRLAQTLDRCISRRVQEGIRCLWLKRASLNLRNEAQVIIDKSMSSALLEGSYLPRNTSCCLPNHISIPGDATRGLSRRLFAVTRELQGLRKQNQALVLQIEENGRRQEIESKKKKESLQMLAEEMADKNQLIAELQATLQFYETRFGRPGGNVLQQEGVALRRELQSLEKSNEKLNLELERRNQQLIRVQDQLAALSDRVNRLDSENADLKQRNFQMGVQLQGLQKRKRECANLSLFLERKLYSLKKYEKLISSNLKAFQQERSGFNSSLRIRNSRMLQQGVEQRQSNFSPISYFEAQYKIEKILNFLFNIEVEENWIGNQQKLFDNQELEVLNGHKLKFMKLIEEMKGGKGKEGDRVKVGKEGGVRLSEQCGESDEVYFNNNHVSGSIFQVLGGSQKGHKQAEALQSVECARCKGAGNVEGVSRRGESFTIRLLQLQLQKGKQIQKISELKNKLMHIRSIVMNLMKSLQLKSVKQETKDIVEVLCQFFEYSEEEKQAILQVGRNQKRFLGWF